MSETNKLLPSHVEQHEQRENEKVNSTVLVNAYAVIWTSMILFGAFALGQYILPALLHGEWARWDTTDAGLYRSNDKSANIIMVAHMICGVCLQALGPIQLIPSFRRKYIKVHRIMGRIYIASALGASGLATIYVLLYRTSRQWIHEDIGNVIFGSAVFGSAAMSLWHVRNGDIANHKIWSIRLFLAVFGATLFRVVSVPYAVAVLLGAPTSQAVMNSLFYVMILPPWLGYELVRRKQWEIFSNDNKSIMTIAMVIWAILTFIIFVGAWLPAILNQPSLNGTLVNE
ncbi:unnamed protein product [Cylindrotheca closterium]|uniref:DUF2306 domain-containing protein n=1 Tax=Cylindrotheca closterium TaxID=2856 RepID=A0AAD2FNH1_9STRA|nr:unnamed protein product [Cylindrotheca closterium]